jgi:hypothetical protein
VAIQGSARVSLLDCGKRGCVPKRAYIYGSAMWINEVRKARKSLNTMPAIPPAAVSQGQVDSQLYFKVTKLVGLAGNGNVSAVRSLCDVCACSGQRQEFSVSDDHDVMQKMRQPSWLVSGQERETEAEVAWLEPSLVSLLTSLQLFLGSKRFLNSPQNVAADCTILHS